MEIIILGFILFIVGVAATIIYDKYGDRLKDLSKIKEFFRNKKVIIMQKQFDDLRTQVNKTTPKKKSQEEVLSEPLRERNQQNYDQHIRRTIKPGPFSDGTFKEGDMPTETQYMEELFDDVSINSTMTVQQLIAKIEQMKKKL